MRRTGTRSDVPELPTLEPGLTLLETDDRTTGPLQALVVDRLLLTDGTARWVDSFGHVRTQSLSRLAPSDRVLDRIRVARAFTAYQHYALVETLADEVDDATSVVVAPALDGRYRDPDGALSREQASTLLVRTLATLAGIARRRDLPVLVTRTRADEFAAPIARAADRVLEVADTPHGPRFTGEAFETTVYPAGNGTVQTTLAFWRRVLEARRPVHAVADDRGSTTEVARGTN